MNMNLLKTEGPAIGPIECFGTAKGISEFDRAIIVREIGDLTTTPMKSIALRSDLDCRQLFNEFRRGLSFA